MSAGAHAAASSTVSVPERRGAILGRRLRRDPLTLVAAAVLALVVLACFVVEPLLEVVLGRGPNDLFPYANTTTSIGLPRPVGPWTWVPNLRFAGDVGPDTPRTLFVLGADSPLGRDELLRILAGGRASLEVAFGSAALAVLLGATLGALAGWFGGLLDSGVSRLTELVMAFPLLLLIIALGQTVADRLDGLAVGSLVPPGVVSLALVIGLFTWFYPARIVRAEVLSLRTREFVEAARLTGAGELRIVRTHVLPHLAAPLAVWGTLIVATNIILESALSFLNLGVRLPTPTWGNLLSANWGTLLSFNQTVDHTQRTPWVFWLPTAAVFVTVLSVALLGEGLRRALDVGTE